MGDGSDGGVVSDVDVGVAVVVRAGANVLMFEDVVGGASVILEVVEDSDVGIDVVVVVVSVFSAGASEVVDVVVVEIEAGELSVFSN